MFWAEVEWEIVAGHEYDPTEQVLPLQIAVRGEGVPLVAAAHMNK